MLDNFIFAMALLGILTAIVSAICVCRGPSLRAFIGRTKEGGRIAEAELCSSTSRDVCKLYHNSTIFRVFGQLKIFKIMHDCSALLPEGRDSRATPGCNIYTFQEYINTDLTKNARWVEPGTRFSAGNKAQPEKHNEVKLEERSPTPSDSQKWLQRYVVILWGGPLFLVLDSKNLVLAGHSLYETRQLAFRPGCALK